MITSQLAGDPSGNTLATAIFVEIDPGQPNRRILTWTPERTTGVVYHLLMDAALVKVVRAVEPIRLLPRNHKPRASIEVIETSPQNEDESLLHVATAPNDRVLCTWDAVAGATRYQIHHKVSGGAYGDADFDTRRVQDDYSFTLGPLTDAAYVVKLTALDDGGDSTTDEENISISSTPEPPTGITSSWAAATSVLTVSWTASTSADVDHYAIRHNSGSGPVSLLDAAEDTAAGASWTIDLTGLTGEYQFLVRAVDSDSKEEQNLSQMVRFAVNAGVLEPYPDIPRNVRVDPAAGGKVTVKFSYYPSREVNGPGGAATANIYNDAGTGTVNYGATVGTLAMSAPTTLQEWTYTSGVLANDTYLYAVRIESTNGVETTNTDTYSVSVDDSSPAAVDLTVALA